MIMVNDPALSGGKLKEAVVEEFLENVPICFEPDVIK